MRTIGHGLKENCPERMHSAHSFRALRAFGGQNMNFKPNWINRGFVPG
jgi:hypothetical protein